MTTSNSRTAEYPIDRQFLERWSPRVFTQDAIPESALRWTAHGMAGIERDHIREELAIPEDYAIEAAVAIGRAGDKASLPEGLQKREAPSPRQPLSAFAAEGQFVF